MIYCASRHNFFTILPLLKKIVMLAIRGPITFTKECISHYKIYENKMVQIYLFCYTVKIRLREKGSLIFCKNKNGVFTFIPFDPKKIKTVSERVFVLLIWICCNSQVVSRAFGYFNMHKLLFKFEDGWHLFRTSQ